MTEPFAKNRGAPRCPTCGSEKAAPPCQNCGYDFIQHDSKNGWCFNGMTGEDATRYEPATPSADIPLKELLDEYRSRLTLWSVNKPFQDAARQAIEEAFSKLSREIKAMDELYTQVTSPLQDCCQRHHLGLGGEMVHELVIEEVDRLRSSSLTPEEAAWLLEYHTLALWPGAVFKYPDAHQNSAVAKIRSLSSPGTPEK